MKKPADTTIALDQCPVRDGFRLRGHEMTRLETFTDAAFAFAVTLLVVSVDAVPTNFLELIAAIQDIPAFLASFLLLMIFWHGHWTWSRRFGLEDLPSIWLSGGLVFVVLCFVYPLKFIASLFMRYFSGGRLSPGSTIAGPEELFSAFLIYGIGFVSMCLALILLNLYSWRHREALQLSRLERFDTRAEIGAWVILASVGLISIFLSLVLNPGDSARGPGTIYMILVVVMPGYGVLMGRRRDKLLK